MKEIRLKQSKNRYSIEYIYSLTNIVLITVKDNFFINVRDQDKATIHSNGIGENYGSYEKYFYSEVNKGNDIETMIIPDYIMNTTNSSITISLDSSWYRSNPNSYQNTTVIILSSDTPTPTHTLRPVKNMASTKKNTSWINSTWEVE
jgi:hypothetical protein